jgi:hypothetical protein
MLMRKWFLFVLIFLSLLPASAKAESQDACAIWLCLPGGFPEGCSGAHREFKDRIEDGKPPLPPFSACSVDGKGNGKYERGVEYFEPCEAGYILETRGTGREQRGECVIKKCAERRFNSSSNCRKIPAQRRAKPNYIRMWIDGKDIGKFFY